MKSKLLIISIVINGEMLKEALLIIWLFIFFSGYIHAQNTYQIQFKNPSNDLSSCMIEDNNRSIIAVGSGMTSSHSQEGRYAKIWKISSEADTLTKTLIFQDTSVHLTHIIQIENGNYLVFGIMFLPPVFTNTTVLVLELDQDFEIIKQKKYLHKWLY